MRLKMMRAAFMWSIQSNHEMTKSPIEIVLTQVIWVRLSGVIVCLNCSKLTAVTFILERVRRVGAAVWDWDCMAGGVAAQSR
jgi:hypothetical protein